MIILLPLLISLAVPDGASDVCGNLLLMPDFTQFRQKVVSNLAKCEGKDSSNAALCELFFGSLIWQGAETKKQTAVSQRALLGRINVIASKSYAHPSVKLLQGWWLASVASDSLFRNDNPSSSVRKKVKFPNGKESWVTEIHYDTVDPRLERGKKLCAEGLQKVEDTPLGKFYTFRTSKDFPVTGPRSIRSFFRHSEEPYKWFYMRELIYRDAASSDAQQLITEWNRLCTSKDRPVIISYMIGEILIEKVKK